MADEFNELQKWYLSQCEDATRVAEGCQPWQDRYGISIVTSDNPAWNVSIDLTSTDLEGATMEPIDVENGTEDWIRCSIVDNTFGGVGGPLKLTMIIRTFLDLVPPVR